MPVTYDPARSAELVRTLRATVELLTRPCPACTCTGWYDTPGGEHELHCAQAQHESAIFRATHRAPLTEIADQLEAAGARAAPRDESPWHPPRSWESWTDPHTGERLYRALQDTHENHDPGDEETIR